MPPAADASGIGQQNRRAYRDPERPQSWIGCVADGWARIGRAVRDMRRDRRQTQDEFAREVGLSERLLGTIERGEATQYDPNTIHIIERVLGWQHGSVQRVVEGGQPIVEHDPQLARIVDAWPRLSDDARAILSHLAGIALRFRR